MRLFLFYEFPYPPKISTLDFLFPSYEILQKTITSHFVSYQLNAKLFYFLGSAASPNACAGKLE